MSEIPVADAEIKEDSEAKEKEKEKIHYPPIKEVYTTKPGECLIEVAYRYGFASVNTLLNHPDNKELKEKLKAENIKPGEIPESTVVSIPESGKGSFQDASGNFTLKIFSKQFWFAARLKTQNGDYLSGVTYVFKSDKNKVIHTEAADYHKKVDLVGKENSDKDGIIQFPIPYNLKFGELTIWPYGTYNQTKPLHYLIEFGSIDQESTPAGDRKRVVNKGLISVIVNKIKAISKQLSDLKKNPGKIIPPENFMPDNHKGLLNLCMIEKHSTHELKVIISELEKEKKNKTKDIKKYYSLIDKKWQFSKALFKIQNQLLALKEDVRDLQEYFKTSHENTPYNQSYKLNADLIDASFETIDKKPDETTLEKLTRIIPLDPYHLELLGGIDVIDRKLEKEKNNLKRIDAKLNRSKEYNQKLMDYKTRVSRRVLLLQYQVDHYNASGADRRGLVKIGTIADEKPDRLSVERLVCAYPEFGSEWGHIVHSRLNSEKSYSEITQGTEIYINPNNLEIIWGDQEPASTKGPGFNIPGYDVLIRRQYLIRFDDKVVEKDYDKITNIEIPEMPLQLKFSYDDSVGGEIKNSNIIYFACDGDKNEFAVEPKDSPVMYPVGFGITDSGGWLIKSPSLSSLGKTFSGVMFHHYTKEQLHSIEISKAIESNVPAEQPPKPVAGFYTDDKERATYALTDSKVFEDVHEKIKTKAKAGDFNKSSMNYFSPAINYGFFAYPAYHGSFQTKSLFELAETTPENSKIPVVKTGRIENLINKDSEISGNIRYIKLFCPLPQWEMRIKEQMAIVLEAVQSYEKSKLPYYQNLMLLSEMQNMTEMNLEYPFWAQDEENIKNKEKLAGSLEELQSYMSDRIENPENPDYDFEPDIMNFRERKSFIKKELTTLRTMLESKEFKYELKAYFKHINKAGNDNTKEKLKKSLHAGGLFPPGPYMEIEENWATIFEAIAEAYGLILRLDESYGFNEKDLKDTLLAFLDEATLNKNLLAYIKLPSKGFDDYSPGKEILNELQSLKKEINKSGKKTIDDLTTLPSIIVNGYNEYIDTHGEYIESVLKKVDADDGEGQKAVAGLLGRITATPGPPSVLEIIVNHMGPLWVSQSVKYRNSSVAARFFHITMPVLFMKTCSIFGVETESLQFKTAQKAVFQTLEHPNSRKNADSPFEKAFSFMKHSSQKFVPQIYKKNPELNKNPFGFKSIGESFYRTGFLLLNVSCLIYDFQHNQADTKKTGIEETKEQILSSIATWGNAAQQAGCGYFLVKKFQKEAPSLAVLRSAEFLAVLLSGLTAYLYWKESERLIKENAAFDKILMAQFNFIVNSTITAAAVVKALARYAERMIVKHGLVRGVLGAIAGAASGVLEYAVIVEFFGFLYSTRKTLTDKGYKITHGTTAFAVELLWSRFSETNMNIAEAQYRSSGYHGENHPDFVGALIVTEEQIINETWGGKINSLIKDIEQIHDTTLLTNLDWEVTDFEKEIDKINPGISWSPLSWHAVIPLYEYGMDPEFIKKIVMIPEYLEIDEKKNQIAFMPVFDKKSDEPEFFHLSEDFVTKSNEIDYIDSVDDLLAFYKYFNKNKDSIDSNDYVSLPSLSLASTIISELQTGTFEPVKYMSDDKLKFEDWERWALSTYDQPANRKGLIALEPLVRSINDLKAELAELKRKKAIDTAYDFLGTTEAFFEKHPKLKYHPAYGLQKLAVVVTPIVKELWKAGNVSMVGFRTVSVLIKFQGEDSGIINKERILKEDLSNRKRKYK